MTDDAGNGTGSLGADAALEALLVRHVEGQLAGSSGPTLAELCRDRPDLLPRLEALASRFAQLDAALGSEPLTPAPAPSLPSFPGFRTIERLGRGGSGEVYKLEDQTLGRIVAAKLIRSDGPLATRVEDFLREARSQALFEDPRFVRLLEYRASDPPVLLMEFVDGFPLSEIGPSLEPAQRARLVAEVAEALQRAHDLGLQHRDLKPGNILVDAALRPRLLDFGLSRSEPDRGHGLGTLAYMAPEQLDPARPIDGRADVYALGVVLFELICGARPYGAHGEDELIATIRRGEPALLPAEIDPSVPEPLQAIALKAMAGDPVDRYATARELAHDLRRYLEGRPVLARPPAYRSALERRIRPHLEQIEEWQRLNLIYPHEARNLRTTYRKLEVGEGDWLLGARSLSFSQITLYLGAFLLGCGGLLYFVAHLNDAVRGFAHPLAALVLPFMLLAFLAFRLGQAEHKPAAVAYHLGAALLLPAWLLIVLRELAVFATTAPEGLELFEKVTNRQLQWALLGSACWLYWLAVRTRTVALSSGFALLLLAFHLACAGDFGLRQWLEHERWDLLALALLPLLALVALLGGIGEQRRWPFLAQPLHFLAAGLFVASLELLALDGRALGLLGVTLAPLQQASVSDPLLLDSAAAMVLNGLAFLFAGVLLERHGTPGMKAPGRLLEAISPFAVLEPLAALVYTGEYSRRLDWLYLGCALAIAFASRFRQRRGFYAAGLLNTGIALLLITDHYEWLDRIGWALAVLAAGATSLGVGLWLERLEGRRRTP